MSPSRREVLATLGACTVTGLAGCSALIGGPQEYAPVAMENRHDERHMVSLTVTSLPDEYGGFTEYFTETWYVDPGEVHRFEEGLAFTDYAPDLMALAVLEDETTERQDFTFGFDLAELRVRVTETGGVSIQPQYEN